MAKKGKSFTELGEGGRQMGSGTTAVDVFGNRVLQGVCRYVLLVHTRTSYTIKILSPIISHIIISHNTHFDTINKYKKKIIN